MIFTQLHSTLNKDGKKYLVDLRLWAKMTLDSSRYQQFLSDMSELDQIAENTTDSEPIYSQADLNSKSKIIIGTKINYGGDQAPSYTEKYDQWQQEFSNDPNVIYRPIIRVE